MLQEKGETEGERGGFFAWTWSGWRIFEGRSWIALFQPWELVLSPPFVHRIQEPLSASLGVGAAAGLLRTPQGVGFTKWDSALTFQSQLCSG